MTGSSAAAQMRACEQVRKTQNLLDWQISYSPTRLFAYNIYCSAWAETKQIYHVIIFISICHSHWDPRQIKSMVKENKNTFSQSVKKIIFQITSS